ncbi:MAG: DUF418 domain-containing protein [Reichenbachiella sp.]
MKSSADLPISSQERIEFLDVLRGIAILFIFTANIPWLSGLFERSLADIQALPTYPIDYWVNIVIRTFVEGKFYTLFSLLFGIGFAVQYNSFKSKGSSFPVFFSKRMLGLTLIGGIHLFLFWLGDILTLYAVLGFALIGFRDTSNKTLLVWTVVLILLPIMNWISYSIIGFYPGIFYQWFDQLWAANSWPMRDAAGFGGMYADFTALINAPSISELVHMNIYQPIIRFGYFLEEARFFKIFGIFLLGVWIGRKLLDGSLLSDREFLRKLAFWGILIGLPMNLIFVYTSESGGHDQMWGLFKVLSYALGVVPMTIGYSALLALWWESGKRKGLLLKFAPVGRMALSNYLFQTGFSILVFYQVGFGYGGTVGYTVCLIFVLLTFSWQMAFSNWWLARFKFGPMEWIWRQMTYGKIIDNRKQ